MRPTGVAELRIPLAKLLAHKLRIAVLPSHRNRTVCDTCMYVALVVDLQIRRGAAFVERAERPQHNVGR